MPCNLTADRQVLAMVDQTGEGYDLYFRIPTNAERVAFANALYEKKGRRTVPKDNVFADQVAMGKKLCLGFSEGYFMDGDAFISSDPAKPYYRKDWKDLIEAARPSDFQQIAIVALKPSMPGGADDLAPGDEEGEVEAPAGDAEGSDAAQAKAEGAPLESSSEPS